MLLVFFFGYLYARPYYQYWFGFDQQSWLRHATAQNCNPRREMVPDLMAHHLPAGTARQTVMALLGTPYEDENELAQRTPPHLPASLRQVAIDSLAKGPVANSGPKQHPRGVLNFGQDDSPVSTRQDTLLRYPVSMHISDPDFLIIHLSAQGRVVRYHVQSH